MTIWEHDEWSARELVEELQLVEVLKEPPEESFDLGGALRALSPLLDERIVAGSRIGFGVGSRGIARLNEVVAALASQLKARGADVVLIPAMGSHGGATAEGQVEMLRVHGIDPEGLGLEVDASMEVELLGHLASGRPVYCSKAALALDGFVPVNRVKPHTSFRAPIESGLTKMLSIGIGKERGAASLHEAGFPSFAEVLPEAARVVLASLPVPFGVAMFEDPWHRLRRLEGVPGEAIVDSEPAMLAQAWASFPRLPFDELDVLVVRELGKMISGAGMDPNVTGRFMAEKIEPTIAVARLAVLDLAESSHGNATGVGAADVVTDRLRRKIDWDATYTNVITSKSLDAGRLPVVAPDDLAAIALSISSVTRSDPVPLRLAAMANTLAVGHLALSEPLVETAESAGYRVLGPCRPELDGNGTLVRIGGLRFFA